MERLNHIAVGRIGEEHAANYLMHHGYRILHRNWRLTGRYEIDIVALKDSALHFIEVKTRTSPFSTPQQAVNTEKIRHIAHAAMTYKSYFHLYYDTHIDAIGVYLRSDEDFDIILLEDVHLNLTHTNFHSSK